MDSLSRAFIQNRLVDKSDAEEKDGYRGTDYKERRDVVNEKSSFWLNKGDVGNDIRLFQE